MIGRLVAKQPNTLSSPINKGLPKVERSFRRHLSSRQVKSSLSRSSSQKLSNKSLLIEESSSSSAIHHLTSKFVRFEKKLPSPQVNTLTKRRIGRFSYRLGISKRFWALSQKEVQNTLAATKESSLTKKDDESSSTGSDNKVYYENPVYKSSMAEDSTASSISLVMVTRTLSTKEQLENLTRLVEGLVKQTKSKKFDAVKVGVDGSIISIKECQALVEIAPTNEEPTVAAGRPGAPFEPVKALKTPLKSFIRPIEDAKMEGSKTVKILDTSSKDFDKLRTSCTRDGFDPNTYKLPSKMRYNSKSQSLENGNTIGLGYKCKSPICL
ncbi:hypothetical protein M9H77_02056 [Catharanthus roseus]|uniref:Uncharacterized protein n=1 Tax=Catharanthus roseus TaxID=4058 RepID=A0ACC0C7G4_CATRO|nr:hypothetical protein M9H77_02056 [Catharanthus roseus]